MGNLHSSQDANIICHLSVSERGASNREGPATPCSVSAYLSNSTITTVLFSGLGALIVWIYINAMRGMQVFQRTDEDETSSWVDSEGNCVLDADSYLSPTNTVDGGWRALPGSGSQSQRTNKEYRDILDDDEYEDLCSGNNVHKRFKVTGPGNVRIRNKSKMLRTQYFSGLHVIKEESEEFSEEESNDQETDRDDDGEHRDANSRYRLKNNARNIESSAVSDKARRSRSVDGVDDNGKEESDSSPREGVYPLEYTDLETTTINYERLLAAIHTAQVTARKVDILVESLTNRKQTGGVLPNCGRPTVIINQGAVINKKLKWSKTDERGKLLDHLNANVTTLPAPGNSHGRGVPSTADGRTGQITAQAAGETAQPLQNKNGKLIRSAAAEKPNLAVYKDALGSDAMESFHNDSSYDLHTDTHYLRQNRVDQNFNYERIRTDAGGGESETPRRAVTTRPGYDNHQRRIYEQYMKRKELADPGGSGIASGHSTRGDYGTSEGNRNYTRMRIEDSPTHYLRPANRNEEYNRTLNVNYRDNRDAITDADSGIASPSSSYSTNNQTYNSRQTVNTVVQPIHSEDVRASPTGPRHSNVFPQDDISNTPQTDRVTRAREHRKELRTTVVVGDNRDPLNHRKQVTLRDQERFENDPLEEALWRSRNKRAPIVGDEPSNLERTYYMDARPSSAYDHSIPISKRQETLPKAVDGSKKMERTLSRNNHDISVRSAGGGYIGVYAKVSTGQPRDSKDDRTNTEYFAGEKLASPRENLPRESLMTDCSPTVNVRESRKAEQHGTSLRTRQEMRSLKSPPPYEAHLSDWQERRRGDQGQPVAGKRQDQVYHEELNKRSEMNHSSLTDLSRNQNELVNFAAPENPQARDRPSYRSTIRSIENTLARVDRRNFQLGRGKRSPSHRYSYPAVRETQLTGNEMGDEIAKSDPFSTLKSSRGSPDVHRVRSLREGGEAANQVSRGYKEEEEKQQLRHTWNQSAVYQSPGQRSDGQRPASDTHGAAASGESISPMERRIQESLKSLDLPEWFKNSDVVRKSLERSETLSAREKPPPYRYSFPPRAAMKRTVWGGQQVAAKARTLPVAGATAPEQSHPMYLQPENLASNSGKPQPFSSSFAQPVTMTTEPRSTSSNSQRKTLQSSSTGTPFPAHVSSQGRSSPGQHESLKVFESPWELREDFQKPKATAQVIQSPRASGFKEPRHRTSQLRSDDVKKNMLPKSSETLRSKTSPRTRDAFSRRTQSPFRIKVICPQEYSDSPLSDSSSPPPVYEPHFLDDQTSESVSATIHSIKTTRNEVSPELNSVSQRLEDASTSESGSSFTSVSTDWKMVEPHSIKSFTLGYNRPNQSTPTHPSTELESDCGRNPPAAQKEPTSPSKTIPRKLTSPVHGKDTSKTPPTSPERRQFTLRSLPSPEDKLSSPERQRLTSPVRNSSTLAGRKSTSPERKAVEKAQFASVKPKTSPSSSPKYRDSPSSGGLTPPPTVASVSSGRESCSSPDSPSSFYLFKKEDNLSSRNTAASESAVGKSAKSAFPSPTRRQLPNFYVEIKPLAAENGSEDRKPKTATSSSQTDLTLTSMEQIEALATSATDSPGKLAKYATQPNLANAFQLSSFGMEETYDSDGETWRKSDSALTKRKPGLGLFGFSGALQDNDSLRDASSPLRKSDTSIIGKRVESLPTVREEGVCDFGANNAFGAEVENHPNPTAERRPSKSMENLKVRNELSALFNDRKVSLSVSDLSNRSRLRPDPNYNPDGSPREDCHRQFPMISYSSQDLTRKRDHLPGSNQDLAITITDTSLNEDGGSFHDKHYHSDTFMSSNASIHPPGTTMEEVIDSLLALSPSPTTSMHDLGKQLDKEREFAELSFFDFPSSPNVNEDEVPSTDVSTATLDSVIVKSPTDESLLDENELVEDHDDGALSEKGDILGEELIMVKCRYKKCGKTTPLKDARKTYKSCHNCYTYYCSRECRKLHWEKHKKKCIFSRVGSTCKHIIYHSRHDDDCQQSLSKIARTGYLSRGRGCIMLLFGDPDSADEYLKSGVGEMDIPPTFTSLRELEESGVTGEHMTSLIKMCKTYNPEMKFVLNVAVVVSSEPPTKPIPRHDGTTIKKCAKVRLSEQLMSPRRDAPKVKEDTGTMILTAPPGSQSTGGLDKKSRQVCFINIQRKLRQRGVSLRHRYPAVYNRLCAWVEDNESFAPMSIYPLDEGTGKQFMCVIMPTSDPDALGWVSNPELLENIDLDAEIERLESSVAIAMEESGKSPRIASQSHRPDNS
ncbi:uncharacterized protein [Ptychodera flava]|uniref:uncharacterized protein n=1 Tax=Ptychodera flava TaxID=63121 RepID=UPI003969D87F